MIQVLKFSIPTMPTIGSTRRNGSKSPFPVRICLALLLIYAARNKFNVIFASSDG